MDAQLLIDGADVVSKRDTWFDRQSPLEGGESTRAAAAGVEDGIRAVEVAAAAFPSWAALPPSARRDILNRAADQMASRAEEFVDLVVNETGATPAWGRFNARLGAHMMREAAAMCTQIKGDTLQSEKPGSTSLIFRKPAGVCFAIAPWNGPVILGVRALSMPLACGNTIVLKSSENSPGIHRLIGRILTDAGIPAGVVNIISVAPQENTEVVEAIIKHPAVRRINFTGSARVGRIVGEMAGRHLKPIILELGGKAPFIVLEDANLDEAVAAAAFGAYMHNGQICMSTERLILVDSIADAFVEKMVAKAKTIKSGNPKTGDFQLGSMVDASQTTRVRSMVDDALSKGARLLTGGIADGSYMTAAVIDGVAPGMALYKEESFGPVVSVIRVADGEEAVRVANDSDYGLAGAVFTRDVTKALNMARRLDLGAIHINGPSVHDEAHVPLGGVKNSGFGRFAGQAGVHEFTDLCWVTIEEPGQSYPI